MADNKQPKRSHVVGFVRGFQENKAHNRVIFKVSRTKFILPAQSFSGRMVRAARSRGEPVLVLLEKEQGKTFPVVLDVFLSPTWKMVSAASKGLPVTYDEFVEVELGSES
jgi:hypothetical protein